MSNSKLATSHYWTKNYSSRNGEKISKIIIHHMAGNLDAKGCYNVWKSREASAHYCISKSGKIGQCVDEKYRAWSAANRYWDSRAVAIECANSSGSPSWKVSDATIKSLIKLVADIARRNGIKKITYTGDTSGTLLMHKWFVSTNCPGPYLQKKFSYIAREANKLLGNSSSGSSNSSSSTKSVAINKTYKVIANSGLNVRLSHSTNSSIIGGVAKNTKVKATKKYGNWAYIPSKKGWICLKSGSSIYAQEVTSAKAKKSNNDIAKEVIAGKWGNGSTRKKKLEAAGYDYNTIQSLVNKML